MSTVVAIGETHELEGFALVGVDVRGAETPEEMLLAWQELDPEVGLVILSPRAAATLQSSLTERSETLTVVMP